MKKEKYSRSDRSAHKSKPKLSKNPPFDKKKIENKITNNQFPKASERQQKKKISAEKISGKKVSEELAKLEVEENRFDQNWEKMKCLTANLLEFRCFNPEPLNQEGRTLLENGIFISLWLKILLQNEYISKQIVIRKVKKDYLPNLKEQIQQVSSLIQKTESLLTPVQKNEGSVNTKRSILKTSEKKVTFSNKAICYPELNYNPISFEQKLRNQCGYLLDFLEINNFYRVSEVTIEGIIEQIDELYGIVSIKNPENIQNSILCLTILNNERDHDPELMRKIEARYQIIGFLDLENKNLDDVWMENLPEDSR